MRPADRKGSRGGKVGAAEADAQCGGGVGPRAAMMKCSKQPSGWRSMPRAMLTLAVAILPPFSSPILVRAMHGLAVSSYACCLMTKFDVIKRALNLHTNRALADQKLRTRGMTHSSSSSMSLSRTFY